MSMRGTGSRRAIPAQESILPKTARPIGSGQIPNAIPLLRLVESLDYPPDRLGVPFRYFRRHPDEALRFGRIDGVQPADQEAIANRAYANRIGNGDVESGDGWRFRGRGLKQVTGRANYRAFTEDHAKLFGELIDFEAEPELLGTPRYPVRSALWFWRANEHF
jgi:putative chitinase